MRGQPALAAQSQALFAESLSVAGQIRYYGLLSLLLSVWLSWQAQFFTVTTFIWLSFHHVSSPLSLFVTFLKRGTQIAVYALLLSLAADVILALTSFVMVWRCFDLHQASEQCPQRLLEGSWILFYSANQSLITIFELSSMSTYNAILERLQNAWDARLRAAADADEAKRMLDDARGVRVRQASGVERRLSLFALVPGAAVWIFASPWDAGWLTLAACARPLRDLVGMWASYHIRDGNNTQREFFDTLTTTLSGCFLALSLGAWLWSEELVVPIEQFSATILLDAAKSAYDDPFSFMSDVLSANAVARPEPFLFTFAVVEALVLANKNSPVRG